MRIGIVITMVVSAAERINRILGITGGSSYLEVGVERGRTFTKINAKTKVAVDPKFKFDTTESSGPESSFFECTSDVFFAEHTNSKFDLIFLDGLHTFEQTLRDLLSALKMVSETGVIIIDDVFPGDYAGSLKTKREQREYRAIHAPDSKNAWWGDTYKLIPFIHDFLPALDYRTATEGNKQTVVVPSQIAPTRDAYFPELLHIANLSFYDLEKCKELWKFCDEREIDDFISK